MKKLFTAIIILFFFQLCSAQTDRHGNPVFNSEIISEEELGMNDVTVMYYKIETNIDNKKSSVYVNDDPTLDDYITFATELPSYGFMITTGGVLNNMIMAGQLEDGESKIMIINLNEKSKKEVSIDFKGDITESRAEELINIKADKNAKISEKNGVKNLFFNNKNYKIVPFAKFKSEIYKLISGKTEKKETGSIIDFIKKESIGGGLDYEKSLNKSKLYEFDDIIYSQPEASIYLWAKGVKKLGVESESDALKLYEEIYKKTLEGGMKKAFEAGYNAN